MIDLNSIAFVPKDSEMLQTSLFGLNFNYRFSFDLPCLRLTKKKNK